jgi:hypothetical protein
MITLHDLRQIDERERREDSMTDQPKTDRELITAKRLRELLHYDPETGIFTWRVCRSNVSAGTRAGNVNSRGYRKIRINYIYYRANRLAWFYMTGSWPNHEIDHIDGRCDNDAFSNLRDATRSQNEANRCMQSNNTSGFKGVIFNNRYGKWQAQIKCEGKHKYIGLFDDPRSAHKAYVETAKGLFGEFARA